VADCAHLDQVLVTEAPDPVAGCERCLTDGTEWVHLRMCQTCGYVGCCDDSPGRHATAHHVESGHPIIRSLEPGERWSWCYPDELTLSLLPDDMPDELDPRHMRRRLVQLAIFVALVAGAISVLPGLSDVRERFSQAQPGWIVMIGIIELASCLAYVVAFRGVFCRGMGWRFSYDIGMAEQATNVLLPAGGAGGLALGAWALREGGMSTTHIARRSIAFFIITSTPNFICAAIFGAALATGVLPGDAPAGPTWTLTGLAFLTIVAVLSLPRLLARWSFLPRVTEAVSAGVRDSIALVRSRDPLIIGGSVGYMAFDVLALVAAFNAFGDVPPVGSLLFAYVIGQLGGLIPLPGGIGGTDGGLIGAQVLYGTPLSEATAAILAYRAFQLALPALLGIVAFVQLRRTLADHDAPAALCIPLMTQE
jgi:uncharacterized membrane protein YbhN (UPF0104 family)